MNRIEVSLVLFIIILCITPILKCKGQTSDLKIVAEPYQWNDDMKRLEVTTPERGLTFKITISNTGTDSIEINKVYITVRVETESRMWSFHKQLEINYLYLPPNEIYYRFVEIDFGGGSIIGSYSAELTYGTYIGQNNPIEPYPFDFRVLSQEMFQQEIEQNKGGTTYVFPINIEISLGVVFSVSLAIFAVYFLKKRR